MARKTERSQFKLCISVSARTLADLSEKVERARGYEPDLLELRLDYLRNLDGKKISKVEQLLRGNEILTLRSKEEGGAKTISETKRMYLLRKVILSLEPKYIDVEIKALAKDPSLVHELEKTKTKLIASYHDLRGKKSLEYLRKIVAMAPIGSKSLYAVKIVSNAKRSQDNLRIIKLYSTTPKHRRLIAFCLGEKGVKSRVLCLLAGSPFSYCSLPGEPLAPGQLDIEGMRKVISSWSSKGT